MHSTHAGMNDSFEGMNGTKKWKPQDRGIMNGWTAT